MQNFYIKKKKTKHKTSKLIANQYLNNISLNDSFNEKLFSENTNGGSGGNRGDQYKIFLYLNTIKSNKNEQTDYFNCYKEKLINENSSKKQLFDFIQNEFYPDTQQQQQDTSSCSSSSNSATTAATVKPVKSCLKATSPKLTSHHDHKKISIDASTNGDADLEYLETIRRRNEQEKQVPVKQLSVNGSAGGGGSNQQQRQLSITSNNSKIVNNSNLKKLNNQDSMNSSVSTRLGLSKSNDIEELKLNPSTYQRTISESSNESHSISGGVGGGGTKVTKIMYQKRSSHSILDKLVNEKLVFAANNAAISMFSRIPFTPSRSALIAKQDLNESFQFTRTRHISLQKSANLQEQFVNDVFELYDLDYDEYLNSDIMSYEYLIDAASYMTKNSSVRDDLFRSKDQQLNEDEENEDLSDKEEFKFVKSVVKKEPRYRRFSVDPSSISLTDRKYKRVLRENGLYSTSNYNASYLDDPNLTELTAGKNRTCLKFASYSVSLIDYVKPLDFKKEINETFKEKFPYLQITLTKLRSLKHELYLISCECSMDLVIVAQSFIYFEKLILQGLITKANRKYLAGASLLIAAKLNDLTKKEINRLIDAIVQKFRLDNRKELISFEFPILVALEFNLITNCELQLQNHYDRIMSNFYTTTTNSNLNRQKKTFGQKIKTFDFDFDHN